MSGWGAATRQERIEHVARQAFGYKNFTLDELYNVLLDLKWAWIPSKRGTSGFLRRSKYITCMGIEPGEQERAIYRCIKPNTGKAYVKDVKARKKSKSSSKR